MALPYRPRPDDSRPEKSLSQEIREMNVASSNMSLDIHAQIPLSFRARLHDRRAVSKPVQSGGCCLATVIRG
jgi:hypothetical protein